MTALIKSEFCTVRGGAMSAFSPGGAPGYLADSEEFATVQYQTSFLAPNDPKCGRVPTGTSTGYIAGYRQATCPRGYTYQYYPSDGSVCWQRNSLLSLAIAPSNPTIPSSSGVMHGKVLTTADLSLMLQQNGQPARGKQVHLTSDRGAADQIDPTQPLTTDGYGKASAKVSTRAQPGTSTLRANDSNINTTAPAVVRWLPAQYDDGFLITCYTIANEADAPAISVSKKVCGLPPDKVYRSAFLSDAKRQGSGKALDGSIIHYNARSSCYNTDSCARTASGACAAAGTTVAVDFGIVPRRSTLNVAIVGQRQAQDAGGLIRGYHIDEYLGPQPALCKQLGRRRSAVTLQNYREHRMKNAGIKAVLQGVIALAALAGPVMATAQAPSSCKALVQVKNNLWWARADGSALAQVTNDSQARDTAAPNANGSVIAFSGKAAPNDVTLIDATGRLITDINLQATDAITGLKWIGPNLLAAEEHEGPNVGRFHYIQVGSGNAVSVLPISAEGSSCAAAPNGKDVACAVGGAAVELNGRTIYRATGATASATTVQAIDIAVGTGATISTTPAFRVEVLRTSDAGSVQLRITTADGLWTEQFVPRGAAMDVQFADAADGTPRYAVAPVVSANSGVVRLSVLRSSVGDYTFEGGLAWDPRGKRLAVVEANPSGQRFWVLLDREMGQAATSGAGAVDAREALPIQGPVTAIAFTSETHLRIEGAGQALERDIPAQGEVPPGGKYAITSALPQRLTVKVSGDSAVADVKGWSCP